MVIMMTSQKTFQTFSEKEVEDLLESQPEGKNTKFLKSSHNLWFRFHNYDKNPPFVMLDDGKPVALVFATFSQRSKYINLYEIVTLEGMEGKGYASQVWQYVMQAAYDSDMRRLKISCTPSSITWHVRNGLIFWAVDPSGSLRSDQPLFRTRQEQLDFREEAVKNPSIAFPADSVYNKLLAESLDSYKFGAKKRAQVEEAIKSVGKYWLRDSLVNNANTLEEFFNGF